MTSPPPTPGRKSFFCAVCWKNPDGSIGTNATTRLCPSCRKDAANKRWSVTPRRERNAYSLDESRHRGVGFDVKRGPEPYSNAMCIRIIHLWLLRWTQTAIAGEVGCSQPYVFKVVKYWRVNRLNTLRAFEGLKLA